MKFVIYGTNTCPFCDKAKELLKQKGFEYDYIDIRTNDEGYDFIVNNLKLKTVPQIFYNDEKIGGYDDLVKYFKGE